MKRTIVLVNKDFEYRGFIEGLREVIPVSSGTNGRDAECRIKNVLADVYCIEHLFDEKENSSNSHVKYGLLKKLFRSNEFRIGDVEAVLSVSTAESTPDVQGKGGEESRNGCVYVGNRFISYDQRLCDPTTKSDLELDGGPEEDSELFNEKEICDGLYAALNKTDMAFKWPYRNASANLGCTAGDDFVSVGVVNVMDYSCYKDADAEAYKAYASYGQHKPVCIETTHGVVVKAFNRVCRELGCATCAPVAFVSPIVDRYLKFDEDVDGKYGRQNFVCSYNGGVATGHILSILNAKFGERNAK